MIAQVHPDGPDFAGCVGIDNRFCKDSAMALTVWKKSLVFSCSGFTVYDSSGNLVFRVDNYCSDPMNEILLMDDRGMALLTIHRKRLSLHNEWQGFLGEFQEAQKPLFVVRKAPSLLLPTNNLGEVYLGSFDKSKQKQNSDYHIEGCYAKRSFTIFNSSGNVVAEGKPKQVKSDQIKLGGDVFNLVVQPGYDQAFVMGLIIILNQMMPSD